ncbi:pyruvate dehydrogenase (acetyl-transferring) E1 component subunit alpha [Microbacterium sp. 5K110]|uniref:pyruvate dehydrogenase (acetyl-transferring) E1 component subunit alpha n=2 Tax=unclassified Microbacterium TaxID=2609290 RepID=UPI0010FF47FF|nr:pyruvate dehydrogenase (acetyl-transferring) E1 component subunit alpha [Microbacterium sp. 5K110]TLF30039.1 pyruvate dehydrogenase (acetyl-transferring) E1 component subunit alpha [Microbacterium sp. 5K110]
MTYTQTTPHHGSAVDGTAADAERTHESAARGRTPRSEDGGDVARLLEPDGTRVPDPALDPWIADLSPHELRALHRDMVLTRRLDAEGVALQRQGQLALWAPCRGQEAVQIGTAHALSAGDFAFPSYREHGVLLARGAKPEGYMLAWRGEEHSAYDHASINVAPMQIIIGAQALHATGWAMGAQRDGSTDVAVAYFGDGATSQGDVNEAMVFASSFGAPVVFVCSNNQWAISEPVTVQAKHPIAGRAPGFGIPSLRIDGNDVLACVAAMRWALDRARRGEGPSFLEAVTYRMGPHTTSDDPTRYRTVDEVERWAERDPIARFEAYLCAEGVLDDSALAEVAAAADALAAEVRAACIGAVTRAPETVFDHVYAEPHAPLAAQRAEYVEYLAGFATEEDR